MKSFIFLQAADAKTAWKGLDKKEKKKWTEKLEPKRQKYIEVGSNDIIYPAWRMIVHKIWLECCIIF